MAQVLIEVSRIQAPPERARWCSVPGWRAIVLRGKLLVLVHVQRLSS
jgi:hypothetical protein